MLLNPLVDSNNFPVSWGDVVHIFGSVDAESDWCNAPQAGDPADETAYEPGEKT